MATYHKFSQAQLEVKVDRRVSFLTFIQSEAFKTALDTTIYSLENDIIRLGCPRK